MWSSVVQMCLVRCYSCYKLPWNSMLCVVVAVSCRVYFDNLLFEWLLAQWDQCECTLCSAPIWIIFQENISLVPVQHGVIVAHRWLQVCITWCFVVMRLHDDRGCRRIWSSRTDTWLDEMQWNTGYEMFTPYCANIQLGICVAQNHLITTTAMAVQLNWKGVAPLASRAKSSCWLLDLNSSLSLLKKVNLIGPKIVHCCLVQSLTHKIEM